MDATNSLRHMIEALSGKSPASDSTVEELLVEAHGLALLSAARTSRLNRALQAQALDRAVTMARIGKAAGLDNVTPANEQVLVDRVERLMDLYQALGDEGCRAIRVLQAHTDHGAVLDALRKALSPNDYDMVGSLIVALDRIPTASLQLDSPTEKAKPAAE